MIRLATLALAVSLAAVTVGGCGKLFSDGGSQKQRQRHRHRPRRRHLHQGPGRHQERHAGTAGVQRHRALSLRHVLQLADWRQLHRRLRRRYLVRARLRLLAVRAVSAGHRRRRHRRRGAGARPSCPRNTTLLDSIKTTPRACPFDDTCPFGSFCNHVTEVCDWSCKVDTDCAGMNTSGHTFVCGCLGQCAEVAVPQTTPASALPSLEVSPKQYVFERPATITTPVWGDVAKPPDQCHGGRAEPDQHGRRRRISRCGRLVAPGWWVPSRSTAADRAPHSRRTATPSCWRRTASR